jgi:hypothetical protein
MSTTALAAALMMLYAAEPSWLPGAQYLSPWAPATPVETIMPRNTCRVPGTELVAGGRRCVDDCRHPGPCKRIRLTAEQQRFYGPRGESLGTATPTENGFVYRDAQGKTISRSSTSPSGETTFYGPGGNVTGRSSSPPPRPTFPGR